MFDSLRRAEAARKRLISRQGEPDRPTIEPAPAFEPPTIEPGTLDGFPRDFVRELGVLKNSIESLLGKGKKQSLMFVGSTSGEGTTTIVTSYAKLLSLQSRDKVLLIELNARHPSLVQTMGLESHAGVTDYLEGQRNFDAIVQDSRQGSFKVISVGRGDPVNLQLHMDRMFPALLQSSLQRFDTVLIDAPPVIGFPESPPLSSHVDGVVLVVHTGKTKREVVKRSLGLIGQADGRVLGVILNRKRYYIPDFIYRRI
jgi:Mrp family chromosome partitioning ATPase